MSATERIERALAASGRVGVLREALADRPEGIWIVGGAVRDALVDGEIADLDLATDGPARELARLAARALGGHPFELSDRHETWRAAGDPDRTVDVAALRAPTIEADLRLRDFTVNAVAVPLAGGEPIDPCGGIEALERGRLRVTNPNSLIDDPLRLMRAARIAAGFGLEPEPDTVELARAAAPAAIEPAGERRFAELRGMLCGPDPVRALALLDTFEVTPVVLPELAELHGVEQSANHHLDVYEHTIEVLRRWLAIEADLPAFVGELADEVGAALERPLADGLSRREGIRFAAILHDIGKPATRTERDGFIGFRGHDEVGAEMVVGLSRRLRTSRRFADFQAALARHHLVLGFMTHERPLPRRRIWEYLTRTGTEALDVTMLTIADRLAAQGTGVPAEAIEAHLELAREMLAEILALERDGPPQRLLAGDEIATLLGIEGERIGAAVAELAAAQFAGEVTDRAGAEAHLRAWFAARDT